MIYFDNSATTCPSEASLEKMREALEAYGNPGSVHTAGIEARHLYDEAKKHICRTFGIRRPADGDIVFTAGGSESNNLAIFGSIRAKNKKGGSVFITDGEHPSVENCAAELEKQGFRIFRIPTTGGRLDLDFIEKNADSSTVLAALMLVNNETGALYDIKAASEIIREKSPKAFIHCDAVQGYLKVKAFPKDLGVDSMGVSAHKIHGIKGCGALYITADVIKAKKLAPVIYGGGQESGLRSGTENLPAICAFGAAAQEGFDTVAERYGYLSELRSYMEEKLPDTVIVKKPAQYIPGIINITLPGIRSETMLNYLSQYGICVSAGSACSARKKGVSRALTAFGTSDADADSSLRISLSHLNTKEETDTFTSVLSAGIDRLQRK